MNNKYFIRSTSSVRLHPFDLLLSFIGISIKMYLADTSFLVFHAQIVEKPPEY
jgi:hypothetical protein